MYHFSFYIAHVTFALHGSGSWLRSKMIISNVEAIVGTASHIFFQQTNTRTRVSQMNTHERYMKLQIELEKLNEHSNLCSQ